MEFECAYDLFGVRIHLATDSFRIREEAQLFLGAHRTTSEGVSDFRLVFEEAATFPDLGGPKLKPCQGQEHQIVESGDSLFISVAEGIARYDSQQRMGHGYVYPKINGRWHPIATVPLVNLLVVRIMFAAGFLPLHASAVSRQGRFLVLSGEKGAGKSSLALKFHLLGFPLACDDIVYLTRHGKRLLGGGHCQPIKLKATDAERMPSDAVIASGRAGVAGKSLFPAEQFNPTGMNRLQPVEAIVHLQNAAERAAVASAWRDREMEVFYHLLGDSPMLNTPSYRARALELLSSSEGCSLLLVQTSHNVDHTAQTILQALA